MALTVASPAIRVQAHNQVLADYEKRKNKIAQHSWSFVKEHKTELANDIAIPIISGTAIGAAAGAGVGTLAGGISAGPPGMLLGAGIGAGIGGTIGSGIGAVIAAFLTNKHGYYQKWVRTELGKELGDSILAFLDRPDPVLQNFICGITREVPKDPVMTDDGNIYEKSEILKWLKEHDTDPLTRKPLTTAMVHDSVDTKVQIYLRLIQLVRIESALPGLHPTAVDGLNAFASDLLTQLSILERLEMRRVHTQHIVHEITDGQAQMETQRIHVLFHPNATTVATQEISA